MIPSTQWIWLGVTPIKDIEINKFELVTGMSNAFNRIYRRAFKHPKQIKKKYYKTVQIAGRVGFFTKGFIYSTIGGLTLQSAFTTTVHNESPQGVFILFGSFPRGTGYVMLVALFIGVCIYVIWRLWEGTTGQGYDPRFSKKKNFFRYRLSPLASAFVYLLYAAYIVYVFTLKHKSARELISTRRIMLPSVLEIKHHRKSRYRHFSHSLYHCHHHTIDTGFNGKLSKGNGLQ